MIRALILALAATSTASAQDRVASAPGAVLRGLDRTASEVRDIALAVGQTASFGTLRVTLSDCRYPVDNPAGDAFALLTIKAEGLEEAVFEGWMVASSPALNPLEHPRYDVWPIRCTTS
ncbi:MAG: DUF2155 domain-containing protein [Rhodobacteraceae bacterium]|nr:DUF2155 domain-containing protein [Paracoccaceae bacterium]